MKKLLLIVALLFSTLLFSQAVDLAAVSIDPVDAKGVSAYGKKGKKVYLQATVMNNGPEEIPAGEAVAQVTFKNEYLSYPRKVNFKNLKSDTWEIVGVSRISGYVTVGLKNKIPMSVGEIHGGFSFDVTPKKRGEVIVTLWTTLSFTSTKGDVNGLNQYADTYLIIK